MKLISYSPILFFLFFSAAIFSQSQLPDDESTGPIDYKQQCDEIKNFLVKDQFVLNCQSNYHHYNAFAYKQFYNKDEATKIGNLKVASFNLLQPGSKVSVYKDMELVAKLINNWDVVAALELVGVLGKDLENNNEVISFLQNGPTLIQDLEKKLTAAQSINDSLTTNILTTQLTSLKQNLALAASLYRAPGYFLILQQLMKLDPSWSLLLTPRGQGVEASNVQELTGVFYRARVVRPIVNHYCRIAITGATENPFACLPKFEASFMGQDLDSIFSRRPFLTSFESGNFSFNFLATHVIFTSPLDENTMKDILIPTFGVDDYNALGPGVTKQNYARFAELKVTLDFMKRMRDQFVPKDIILAGDFNIENNTSPLLPKIMNLFPGGQLLINESTSLNYRRFNRDGTETSGYTNNYDHFVLDPNETSECSGASRYDIYHQPIVQEINQRYLIRTEEKVNNLYSITPDNMNKMNAIVEEYRQQLLSLKTIKKNQIIWDDYKFDHRIESLKRRVFLDQQKDETYYRLYAEILSDHAPINLNCRTNL